MRPADKLIKRSALGGLEFQDLGKLYFGEDLKKVIECDLAWSSRVAALSKKAIASRAALDFVTRDIFQRDLARRRSTRTTTRRVVLIDSIGIHNFGSVEI